MATYTYLKARSDGDFDHMEVSSDGTETSLGVVVSADQEYPFGRPTDSEVAERTRIIRNDLLQETDWWASSDLTMTQAQIDYRQALRDLPDHANWPNLQANDWPIKP
jgi:hypothetical protein